MLKVLRKGTLEAPSQLDAGGQQAGTSFADSASAVGPDVSSAGSVIFHYCGLFLLGGKSSAMNRGPGGGKREEEGADEIKRWCEDNEGGQLA